MCVCSGEGRGGEGRGGGAVVVCWGGIYLNHSSLYSFVSVALSMHCVQCFNRSH